MDDRELDYLARRVNRAWNLDGFFIAVVLLVLTAFLALVGYGLVRSGLSIDPHDDTLDNPMTSIVMSIAFGVAMMLGSVVCFVSLLRRVIGRRPRP